MPVGLTRQLVRFAAVGTASTLTYVALYALLCQGLGLGAQAANLAALQTAVPSPSLALELAVLVAANMAAAVLRFLLLRSFVFRSRRRPPA